MLFLSPSEPPPAQAGVLLEPGSDGQRLTRGISAQGKAPSLAPTE